MELNINGEKVKLYFSEEPNGVDVCMDKGFGCRPYICRINKDGTLTLYADVDEIFKRKHGERYIKVKTEFKHGDQ